MGFPTDSYGFRWFPYRFLPPNEVGLLLGKLHLHRCVLDPRETHLAKKAVNGVNFLVNGCLAPYIGRIKYHVFLSGWLVSGE